MICAYIVLVIILIYLLSLNCLDNDKQITVQTGLMILGLAIISPLGIGYLISEADIMNRVIYRRKK